MSDLSLAWIMLMLKALLALFWLAVRRMKS